MPIYTFICPSCSETKSVARMMSDNSNVICDCGVTMSRNYGSIRKVGVVVDGPPSPSQAWRDERMRRKRHLDIGVRQIEEHSYKSGRAVPNVGGEEFDSWGEAQKYAKEKGYDAKSFDALVEKEKLTNNSGNADDRKYKEAVEARRRGGF